MTLDWWASNKGLRIIYATSMAISVTTGHYVLSMLFA